MNGDKSEKFHAQCLVELLCCAVGGYAFSEWQDSQAAGWFMFFALDALGGIGIGLRHVAYRYHEE